MWKGFPHFCLNSIQNMSRKKKRFILCIQKFLLYNLQLRLFRGPKSKIQPIWNGKVSSSSHLCPSYWIHIMLHRVRKVVIINWNLQKYFKSTLSVVTRGEKDCRSLWKENLDMAGISINWQSVTTTLPPFKIGMIPQMCKVKEEICHLDNMNI